MKKLLLTGAINYTESQLNQLLNLGYDIKFIQEERQNLNFDVSNINAIVCNNLFLYNNIERFTNLEFIQLTSSGLDRVPLNYIKRNNIHIFNAKKVYSVPMAEWVVLKILEIYKKSFFFYKNQINHEWKKNRELHELTGKNVCIVGFGNVGIEIAKRLKPFDVSISSINRKKTTSLYTDESLLITDLNYALGKADIIILTLPLTTKTEYIINEEKINYMKKGSVLINVARGKLIDECALINALNNDKFLGVALDVFEEEPLGKSSLWNIDNTIVTPHNSFVSNKVNERLFQLITENLTNYINEADK